MYPMIHAKAGARKPRLDKRRALGRIEHTLLDEGSFLPNRPKTIACNPTIPQKSDKCFYLHQRAGIPIRTPAWGLRGAAVGATLQRLPPQRLSLCGPSLTSSPDGFPVRHRNGKTG